MKFGIVLLLGSVLLATATVSAAVEKDVTELQIGVKVTPLVPLLPCRSTHAHLRLHPNGH